MARIFVRQRRHTGPGSAQPRFAVVAVEGELTFFRSRLRRVELEQIAEATGAELVYLPGVADRHGQRRYRE
jgi:hypothetical protein